MSSGPDRKGYINANPSRTETTIDPWTLLSPTLAYLGLVVFLAAAIQTAIGFGAMLVAVTLGALVWAVPDLPPVLVPLTTLQTAYVSARHRRGVAWDLLLKRILPFMGLGTAIGLILAGTADHPWLKPALGAMVGSLALRELWRTDGPAPGPLASSTALFGAGITHGIFAVGGPLLVWAVGRAPLDKAGFRATLNLVWLVLNTILIATYAARGQLTLERATQSALLLLPLCLGIVAGEWLYHRVDEVRFRRVVWAALALAAIPLIVG